MKHSASPLRMKADARYPRREEGWGRVLHCSNVRFQRLSVPFHSFTTRLLGAGKVGEALAHKPLTGFFKMLFVFPD